MQSYGKESMTMERQSTQRATLKVRQMACGGCAASVERLLRQVEGVQAAQVSFARSEAAVEFDPSRVGPAALAALLAEAGYPAWELSTTEAVAG